MATDGVASSAVLSADVRRTFNLSIASSGDVLASLQVTESARACIHYFSKRI